MHIIRQCPATEYSPTGVAGTAGAAGEAEAVAAAGSGQSPCSAPPSQRRGWPAASGPNTRHRHRSPASLLQQLRGLRARPGAAELRLRGAAGGDRLRKLVQVQRLQLGEGPGHVLQPHAACCHVSEAFAKVTSTRRASSPSSRTLQRPVQASRRARCAHQQRHKGVAARVSDLEAPLARLRFAGKISVKLHVWVHKDGGGSWEAHLDWVNAHHQVWLGGLQQCD